MGPEINNASESISIEYGDIFYSFYNYNKHPIIYKKTFHLTNPDQISDIALQILSEKLEDNQKSIDDVKIYSSTLTRGCDINLTYILAGSKNYVFYKEEHLDSNNITYYIAKV